jgi:Glycosyl hydrolases family 39
MLIGHKVDRRGLIAHLLGLGAASMVPAPLSVGEPGASVQSLKLVESPQPALPRSAVRLAEFNMVGLYDIDWLTQPLFGRLLDHMAASPRAFGAVRFFHALDSGDLANTIDDDPLHGGKTWPRQDAPMDFTVTLRSLAELSSRGLVPFVGLNFFPQAVTPHAATPPRVFDSWQALVRGLLDTLAADPRFGKSAIAQWHFEVWNEPNGRPFWRGSYDRQYLDLYRATSDAVRDSGHAIRLGGPAIVYRAGTEASRAEMRQFLEFLRAEPELKCDFISLHAKGTWSSSGEPDFSKTIQAAVETAELALSIDAKRFSGLSIINDEADMRVGFNIPFQPRMTEQFASWIIALMVAYDELSARFAAYGLRFHAASDNANLHLVNASFDGRRSIMTLASPSGRDLLKLPVFNAYEILRLLGEKHGTILEGSDRLFPHSDLFHIITRADSHICAVFTSHPRTPAEALHTWSVRYRLVEIPWSRVNIACFLIDREHSSSYFGAGGEAHNRPFISQPEAAKARNSQELGVASPIQQGVPITSGELETSFIVAPYSVAALWITPHTADTPSDPVWIETKIEDGNVVLRWRPNIEAFFYSYELYLVQGDELSLISPVPLRSAMWLDIGRPSGWRSYAVRAVTASGVRSNLVTSAPLRT